MKLNVEENEIAEKVDYSFYFYIFNDFIEADNILDSSIRRNLLT